MNPEDLPDAEKAWRLSTRHITRGDSDILSAIAGSVTSPANATAWDGDESPLAIMNYEGGHLLTLWHFDWDGNDPYHAFVTENSLSPALYTILRAAAKAEVRYVRFDVGANGCAAFSWFEW